ncbi:MAG: hypothetical protein LW870_21985 [Pirellula sp.]|jgi:hypothetical protein|nr:hypothetical protein [Pirellula sp.]
MDSTTHRDIGFGIWDRCSGTCRYVKAPSCDFEISDVVATWSDRQVALRWLQIFPRKRTDEQLVDPTTTDADVLANDPERSNGQSARQMQGKLLGGKLQSATAAG